MKISRNNPMIERIERKNKKENLNEEIKIKDEAIIEVPIISAIALKDIEKTKEIVKNNLEEKEEQVEEFVKEQEKKVEEAKKESKKPLTEDYLNENFKDRWTLNEQEYTVKCTGRKELRQLIAEAKISDIKYTFVRLDKQPNFIDEGYKYDFKYSLANGLEKIKEEVETNLNDLTIEELFKKVVDKDLIVFDEEGHFTEEALKHYNDVAKVYGEDKLDKLCSEEHCFKEETKESLKESLSEESKKAFDDLLSYARELYKRDKKTNKEVTTKEVIEEVIDNADPKEIYALAYSYTDVITIQNMIKDKLSKDLEDALEDYIEKEDEEDEETNESLKESFEADDVVLNLVDRAFLILDGAKDEDSIEDAVTKALDEGLVYSKDIWNVAQDYVDDKDLLDLFYEDLRDEVYSRVLGGIQNETEVEEDDIDESVLSESQDEKDKEESLNESLWDAKEWDDFKKKYPDNNNKDFDYKKYGKYFDADGKLIKELEDEYFDEINKDSKDKGALKEALNVIGKLRDYAPSKEAEPL